MRDKETQPKSVRFVYKNSDDYMIIYVNGIHGGLTQQGEISFDLFQEHRYAIKEEIHSIEEDGSLSSRTDVKPEFEESPGQITIVRERKIGVILSPDTAKSIAEWIRQKVIEFEQMQKRKSEEEN